MLKKIIFVGFVLISVITTTRVDVFAIDESELERKSEMIAKLLVSCRAIIAENQDLFNDPAKGDKGFTGNLYTSKVKDHFEKATGVKVSLEDTSSTDSTTKALGTLLVSAKSVIDESQRILNMKGQGFKNIIPAIVGRRTGYKYIVTMGTGYHLKQTSLKYRNPTNHPDAFEAKILKEFETFGYPKGQGKGMIIVNTDGSKVYRYMLPLYIEPPCLKCHGEPKGEKDIAGRIKEGYKEGDMRGAISVMISYE